MGRMTFISEPKKIMASIDFCAVQHKYIGIDSQPDCSKQGEF